MPVFESPEKLEAVLGGFFNHVIVNEDIKKKLLASKIVIKFNYSDPDLSITGDFSGAEPKVVMNDSTIKPEVEMWMKADVAHTFWFGKLDLIAALTRRQMTAKGPIPKILKLLPAIKPAYAMYPQFLEANGFGAYNTLAKI